MLSPADFLRLPYTPDLTEGGIARALRAIPYSVATYHHIRRMAVNAAAELAFRRHLAQHQIPFEVAPSLPMSEHDRHDAILAGRRCDIKSFFISYQNQIAAMRRDPALILNAPALVPSDIDASEGHLDEDLYLFAFVSGLVSTRRDLPQLERHYFIHVMPRAWREPQHWNPLGALTLKSDAEVNAQVEISGQDAAGGFISRVVNLIPQKRVAVEDSFYSILTIHLRGVPSARIGIHAASRHAAHIIAPEQWENLWAYGMEILFAGFMTRGEFRRRAVSLPPNSSTFQYRRTRVKNLFVPVSSLRPMQSLFERFTK